MSRELNFISADHQSPHFSFLQPSSPKPHHPKPLSRWRWIWDLFCCLLACCPINKPFLCYRPQHLSIQFAASQSNEPGLVTLCFYRSTKWINIGEWNIKFININPNHHISQIKVYRYSVPMKSLSPSLQWAKLAYLILYLSYSLTTAQTSPLHLCPWWH